MPVTFMDLYRFVIAMTIHSKKKKKRNPLPEDNLKTSMVLKMISVKYGTKERYGRCSNITHQHYVQIYRRSLRANFHNNNS